MTPTAQTEAADQESARDHAPTTCAATPKSAAGEVLTVEELGDVFSYLDDLRVSGATNMFGAARYLEAFMGLEIREARKALSLWMASDLALEPEHRARAAIAKASA